MAKRKRTPAQIAADKRRTGRPPLPPDQKQGKRVTVNLTASEFGNLAAIAEREGASLAEAIMRPWREKEG